MNNPILHIGYPKTATSWFQNNFYPYVGNINFLDRLTVRKLFILPNPFDYDQTEINCYLKRFSERIVICEELFLGRLSFGGVDGFMTKEYASRLKSSFPDAKIVIFIRNQINILASAYVQYIKGGGNYSIHKFLYPEKYTNIVKRILVMKKEYFIYHKVLRFYRDLFGGDNLHIFLYEDFESNFKAFIEKYIEKLDLDIFLVKINKTRVNEGYRKGLIPLKKIANAFTRKGPLNKYYIIHIPKLFELSKELFLQANEFRIFGNKYKTEKILGKKNIEYLKEYFKESNKILIEEFGLNDITKYNYPV